MGKGKRKHKNKAAGSSGGGGGSGGMSKMDGVIGGGGGTSGRSKLNENEILLSLEESYDWHNQTTGFVSSYTLPPIVSSSVGTSDTASATTSSTSTSANGNTVVVEGHQPLMNSLIQPIMLSRIESLESNASSKADDRESGIRDIFRPPSRSPSRSPKSQNNVGSPQRDHPSSICSPTERSIASDSTDAVSNIATISLPSKPPNGVNRQPDFLLPTKAAAAAAKNAISSSPPMLGHIISANDARDMAGISPLRGSPPTNDGMSLFADDNHMQIKGPEQRQNQRQPEKDKNATDSTSPAKLKRKKSSNKPPKIKKNNLVIHPTPSNLSRSSSHDAYSHRSHKSCSLPPPHPLSHIQSYPPHTYSQQSRHRHSSSLHSISDASCTSSAASEATPIISPAQKNEFSFSDDESDDAGKTSEDYYIPKNISTGEFLHGVNIAFAPDETSSPTSPNNKAMQVGIPQVQSDISDPAVSGSVSNEDRANRSGVTKSDTHPLASLIPPNMLDNSSAIIPPNPEPPIIHPLEGADQEFKGEDFFDSASFDSDAYANHTRQFSSDDRFFEGIHDSGLQSSSFEEVGDSDLNTSMDAEIELVYNTGSNLGGSFGNSFGADSYDTAERAKSPGTESVEERKREEERKEMERRIMQWRKGRNAMRNLNGNHTPGAICPAASIDLEIDYRFQQQQKKLQQNEREEEEEQEESASEDDIEMNPLNYSTDSEPTWNTRDRSKTGDAAYVSKNHSNSLGHYQKDKYSSSHLQWWQSPILVFIKNYIGQLPHDVHSDVHSMDTPRMSNSRTSSLAQATFNTDGEEDDDDGDESKGLTSSTTAHFRRKSSYYDDVDFDRNANFCSRYCCRCCKCCEGDTYGYSDGSQPATWQIHSGWKDLLLVSAMFFLLALIFSHGHLTKHHNKKYPGYYNMHGNPEDDPLAREQFLEEIRHIDDGDDDYYSSKTLLSPKDDDVDFHSIQKYYPADKDDGSAASLASVLANDSTHKQQLMNERYNDFTGIDTIVVLGLCDERHSGVEWLVARLTKLYPRMKVVSGFPTDGDYNAPKPHQLRTRSMKIIDPTSDEQVTYHFTNDGTPITKNDGTEPITKVNDEQHRKSKSNHILVISVFLNPYDWVELMRVDSSGPNYGRSHHAGMDWKEYVHSVTPRDDRNVLDMRADAIHTAVTEAAEHDGVKLVIPVRYEELVEPYGNYDNYVKTESLDESSSLPGIVGLMDQIQARTGLHPDEAAGWKDEQKPSKAANPSSYWAADPIGCTGHICFPSIHKMREDGDYIQYMNDNVDWSAEKLVGYQRRSVPKPPVDQIVVLGERHSGGEWLADRLARCFPNVKVDYGFDRPGKWFQIHPEYPEGSSVPKTLVVSAFLNPYDWVELMREHPINAPAHAGMEWADFVTSPWERRRSHLDEMIVDTVNTNCSYGFLYEEIIPCKTQRDPDSDLFPLYELHPSWSGVRAGDPYSSLLELRADKIRNFMSTADFDGVVDLIAVRYEDLLWDEDYTGDESFITLPFPGIAGLLEKIRDQTSLVPDASAGWIVDEEGIFRADALGVGVAKLDPYYVQWMEEHIDWDAEMLVGYNP